MGWPQIIYLLLNFLAMGYLAAKGRVEATFAGTTLTWVSVTLPLLYWGGFFG